MGKDAPEPPPETATTADPARGVGGHRVARHAAVFGGITLLSRFAGLAREMALSRVLGLSGVADAFFVAFLIPNLFRRLFGEGALTSAFLPHHAELAAKDPQLARRFAGRVIALLTLLLGGLMVAGEAVLWGVHQWVPLDVQNQLAIRLVMVFLPYMPLVCLVAFLAAILQAREKFAASAAVPLVLSGSMIAAASVALALDWTGEKTALLLAASVVLTGLLQLLWLGAGARHDLRLCLRARSDAERGALRGMVHMMGPMVIGLGIFQLNALADALLAYLLSGQPGDTLHLAGFDFSAPCETGAVAALNWAQRLYQLPVGVFGIAIATAVFPALARASAQCHTEQRVPEDSAYLRILRQGIRLSLFIGLPATAGMVLIALPMVRAIYEGRQIDTDGSLRVALILTGYGASIWAYSLNHVLTRAFHARKDPKTPLRNALYGVGVNVALNLTLIWPLGAAGLAWSTAASSAFTCLLNLRSLGRGHLGGPTLGGSDWRGIGRTLLSALIVGGGLWLAIQPLDLTGLPLWPLRAWLLALVIWGAVLWLGSAWLLRAPELMQLLQAVRRKK